jgi:GNAT superfamily N-acetyltransferase
MNSSSSAASLSTWSVRSIGAEDERRWRELYAGYAAFYKIEQTEAMATRVWEWLLDPRHPVEGIVAVDASDEVQGLAHFRDFARPSSASVGGYLDDLFVEPSMRGGGAADALLGKLRQIGGERGWTVIRWITADDNYRARGKYDQFATRTPWITYDMPPASVND